MPATETFRESGMSGAFFCIESGGGLMGYLSERLLIYVAHVFGEPLCSWGSGRDPKIFRSRVGSRKSLIHENTGEA